MRHGCVEMGGVRVVRRGTCGGDGSDGHHLLGVPEPGPGRGRITST